MAIDEDETDRVESGATTSRRQAGSTRGYRIHVRGEIPKDLGQRISALHALAIIQRRGAASDAARQDSMERAGIPMDATTGTSGLEAGQALGGGIIIETLSTD